MVKLTLNVPPLLKVASAMVIVVPKSTRIIPPLLLYPAPSITITVPIVPLIGVMDLSPALIKNSFMAFTPVVNPVAVMVAEPLAWSSTVKVMVNEPLSEADVTVAIPIFPPKSILTLSVAPNPLPLTVTMVSIGPSVG